MHEGEQVLEWLKQAILVHPSYRNTACKDPHFANLKESMEWALGSKIWWGKPDDGSKEA
jgi:hypothetical protein